MNYFLGIHCGHDATATLIDENGNIIASVAEERITRVKYHAGFPYESIFEVLRHGDISPNQIKYIGSSTKRLFHPQSEWMNSYLLSKDLELKKQYDISNLPKFESRLKKLGRVVGSKIQSTKSFSNEEIELFSDELVLKTLKSIGFHDFTFSSFDHHLCHSASAYFCSGQQDSLIITMDGAGDGKCATAAIINDGQIQVLSSASSSCSPGRFYSEITRFLGYKRNRHEGKITGLAAYGDPHKYFSDLKQFMAFDPEKEHFVWNMPAESGLKRKLKTAKRILKGENFGTPFIDYFHEYLTNNYDPKSNAEDLAATVQLITEEIALEYVSHFLKRYPRKNIVLAGGIFANVRVNQRIGELPDVDFLYIHQNMGDGGCATGAGYLIREMHIATFPERPTNVYYGAAFSDAEIQQELKSHLNLNWSKSENIEIDVAQLLANGKIVGRFNGGMEYGPRSLGNRSILASTTDKTINDWLNKRLNRTEFMPFAPSVLEEASDELFEGYSSSSCKYASQFMTVTYNVKPKWHSQLQAAVHVDGTARPQVVTPEQNPSYHKLIKAYYEISGIPGIVNTSFNSHEEPIVMTPEHAIRSLLHGTVDILAIGSYLVKKK